MAIIGEFGAAKAEIRRQTEPDQIRFYGELFAISDNVGTMPLLEFAAAAAKGTDAADMEGLAAMHALLQDCLAPGEWDRFKRVARENKADPETLLAVCAKVYEVIAGRPTVSPSDSAGGPSTTSPSSSESSDKRAALGLVPVDQAIRAG